MKHKYKYLAINILLNYLYQYFYHYNLKPSAKQNKT